ncbi:MAG: 1-deoxy-D-xylulose-5-phosphate synthase [Ruminococcaceae bacterium]|nr:1-deoxy-D-xylulose-5-phosphate synthase [Oscillospiraceae bacterium]
MYQYVDKIKTPTDIKELNTAQLNILCNEIRDLLINSVSQNGGHLASNLGVVELTVALHRVLNCPKDKIVWDVGHQSYVHKILTGRGGELSSIRQMGGLCGFCNPEENEYDCCYTGHASTSLSTALGFAESKKLTGEDYNIAAVIGDGSFTGGLAFEALNNIGNLKSKMLIILNDNEMSIAENVGAFSTLLSKARTNKNYTSSKRKVVERLSKKEFGKKVLRFLRKVKKLVKSAVEPNLLFEQFGITYLGPVNGHNIEEMEDLFIRALSLDEPVIVHVITTKGKGYEPAEKMPQKFHGVGPFEVDTGEVESKVGSYSEVFGKKLCELATENEKVVAITPAMIPGSGLGKFSEQFPERLYDVGIAEGHSITFAGGIAAGGGIPVVSIYSSFLQRAYDNLIHDVALGDSHIVLAVDRAGLVGGDGATHQGLFDISYLTAIPNMTVLSPSSYKELEKMLEYAVMKHNGPIALRYPRGRSYTNIDNGDFGLSKASVVRQGDKATIVAEGQSVSVAIKTAELLSERGIEVEVIDVRTLKPIDFDTIIESTKKTGALLSVEENLKRGGMGEMIAGELKLRNIDVKMKIKAIEDEFVVHGTISELNHKYGFTEEQLANEIERML